MKPSDIVQNGQIILEGSVIPSGYEDWFDNGIICASLVRGALGMFDEGDVTVIVNSPGGDPTEGEAIRAMLADYPGKVTVKVQGDAMSAASLLIMSADVIEMSEGSIMMVHDPSTVTWGTAEEHRAQADILDVLANTYAAVYARRAGGTKEEMRLLMQAELWMSPEDAVAKGFADKITGVVDDDDEPDMTMLAEAGRVRFEAAVAMLADCRKKNSPNAGVKGPMMAVTQEGPEMAPKTKNPANEPETIEQVDTTQIEADARAAERERQKTIKAAAKPFLADGRLTEAEVDTVLDGDMSTEAACAHLMTVMGSREPEPTAPTEPKGSRQDETETRMNGMIGALAGETDGPAMDYRGLRLRSLALELAGPSKGFNDRDKIKRGMMATTMMGGAHGVSDFSFVTAEVMNRMLLAAYKERAATWRLVSGAPMSAADFRELAPGRFGGDFQLKEVQENGELTAAVLADEAEGLKVERRGRMINITFEAIVNDDMGAFNRIPGEFARAAVRMENGMVWALIKDHAVLKSDNTALFHASHSNTVAATGISVTSVGGARQRMWEQKQFGAAADDEEALIEAEADRLIVPPALEASALQFTGATAPTTDSDKNPFKATLEPSVVPHLAASAGGSDNTWFMIDSDLPPISVAYLDGYEAPEVEIVEGMNPRGVTMNADHMFGAAATEFRGAQRIGSGA